MILCSLTDADLYATIHPRIAQGIAYLRSAAWQGLPDGVVELEKDGLYAHIQHYQTIPQAEAQWEAHRIYTDIQYVVEGAERIGCGPIADFTPVTEYDAERDVSFFTGEGNLPEVRAGMLAILSPHDVHLPRVRVAQPQPVSKIVLKVRVD
jgi:biofilm protein TabA